MRRPRRCIRSPQGGAVCQGTDHRREILAAVGDEHGAVDAVGGRRVQEGADLARLIQASGSYVLARRCGAGETEAATPLSGPVQVGSRYAGYGSSSAQGKVTSGKARGVTAPSRGTTVTLR